MTELHLHQIVDASTDEAGAEPGVPELENLVEPRPDWGPYASIRAYLLQHTLDEDAFHGFLPPAFRSMTGYSAVDLEALVARHGPAIDVLLCSPHPSQLAYFLNVVEQGEFFHPGLADAARQWMQAAGLGPCPAQLPMDVRQMNFGTSFVARPSFWREWARWGESLYALCEGPASPLQQQLTAISGDKPVKQLLTERLASLILAVQPQWRCEAADPYVHNRWPTEHLRRDPTDAIVSDALKHAWRQSGWAEYASAFGLLRQRVLAGRS